MALNWNVADIVTREGEDYVWPIYNPPEGSTAYSERAPGKRYLSGLTDCMIWATMFAQIGHITDANWQKFAIRIRAWETITGPISSSGKPLDAETIRRHIGLRTNVSTTTDAAFAKHLAKTAISYAERAIAKEQSK